MANITHSECFIPEKRKKLKTLFQNVKKQSCDQKRAQENEKQKELGAMERQKKKLGRQKKTN